MGTGRRLPLNFMAQKLQQRFDNQTPQFVESPFKDTQKKGGRVLTIEKICLYLIMKQENLKKEKKKGKNV